MNDKATDLEKIKDRIQKLLRMAADSSSPNEAAIAAGRARKLMDQHQITELELKGEIEESVIAKGHGRFFAALPLYLQFFAVAVAKYNDCQVILEGGEVNFKKKATDSLKWGRRPMFRGYESDVQLACDMYDRLEEAVNRLCKEYMQELNLPKYNVRIGGQFKHGAISKISARINAMLREREVLFCESTGKGLMVLKSVKVNEVFGEVNYKDHKGEVFQRNDHEAMKAARAGSKAAEAIEIVPLVN